MKKAFLILLFAWLGLHASAQYTLNGSASQNNCHCYTLTNNTNYQSGSVWNNNRINLTQPFDFRFTVNLGCNDSPGADGIAFVLQPISTSVGSTGSGLGFGGISPSLGVTLDTYQNTVENDPTYDHIAFQKNGDMYHSSANNLAGPVQISATNINVEDCNDHSLHIIWDPSSGVLEAYFDDVLRLSLNNDIINTIFGGNPLVYWGFTGSTGGEYNLQKFCTQLTPSWNFNTGQLLCAGQPVTFNNTSVSFSSVVNTVWNFGDGSPVVNTPNATHVFTNEGTYTITQTVTGGDGCVEVNTQTVTIGAKPIASFTYSDSCSNSLVTFNSTSTTASGSITNYYWELDNGGSSVSTNPATTTYTSSGPKNIVFAVQNSNGCVDTLRQTIHIFDKPIADFIFPDSVCLGSPTNFTYTGTGNISSWVWTYNDSTGAATSINPSHIYTTSGNQSATLTVVANANNGGCASAPMTHPVFVSAKPIAAIRSITNVCVNASISLLDSSYSADGQAINWWWWDLGNGNFSNLQNPTVSYSTPGPKIIKLVVKNAHGCISDTITRTVTIFGKPNAAFTFAAPNCNSTTVSFTDASTVSNGSIASWNWVYNNVTINTNANFNYSFSTSPVVVGLAVTSNGGCKSDTVYQTIALRQKPAINFSYNDTCANAPIIFAANETTSLGINSWHWSFGDGNTSTTNPTTHTYRTNGNYTVSVYGTSANGCNSDTLTGTVHIYGTAANAGPDLIAASGQPIQLHASGGTSYLWTPPLGLSSDTAANPVATLTVDQTYYLTAFSPTGCASFDTMHIKVYKTAEIYVPSAFTPNGDGKNDLLFAIPVGITQFVNFSVFNRYGQLVFTTADAAKGWDGKWKQQAQQLGTYVWMASGVAFDGKLIKRQGTVLLLY